MSFCWIQPIHSPAYALRELPYHSFIFINFCLKFKLNSFGGNSNIFCSSFIRNETSEWSLILQGPLDSARPERTYGHRLATLFLSKV